MSFLLFVLLASSANRADSTFYGQSNAFIMSTDGVKIIIDPFKPFIIGNHKVYWTGYYQPSAELPVLCEIRNNSSCWELDSVRFANGSQPHGIQFGCPANSLCDGYGCVSLFSIFGAVMIITLIMFGVVLFIAFFFVERKRSTEPYETMNCESDDTSQSI